MIRIATLDDIPTVVSLGRGFHEQSPYSWIEFDPDALGAFIGQVITGGVVFLSDDGMIGGVLSPLFFNPTKALAAELFWFARQEGRELRSAFEAWARDQGAVAVTCAGLANEREPAIRRIYTRAGYLPAEVAFVKRITP